MKKMRSKSERRDMSILPGRKITRGGRTIVRGGNMRVTKTTADRREKVSLLLLEELSFSEIAKRLSMTVNQVKSDVDRIFADWRDNALINAERRVRVLLRRISRRRTDARAAWLRSIGKSETTRKSKRVLDSTSNGSSAGTTEVRVETKTLVGNPKFLQVEANCDEQERALLGLDAPKRLEIKLDDKRRDRFVKEIPAIFAPILMQLGATHPQLEALAAQMQVTIDSIFGPQVDDVIEIEASRTRALPEPTESTSANKDEEL